VSLGHRLFFGGKESRSWGRGGVAFIDAAQSGEETRARRYLVTPEQFQDVFAQETGRAVGYEVDLVEARAQVSLVTGSGRYDLVLYLGDHDGHPMFTFTTPDAMSLEHNPPANVYREVVVRGLQEAHGLSAAEAARYVDERIRP